MAGPSFVVPEVSSARRMYEAMAGLGRARWAADRLLSTRYTPPVWRAPRVAQPVSLPKSRMQFN